MADFFERDLGLEGLVVGERLLPPYAAFIAAAQFFSDTGERFGLIGAGGLGTGDGCPGSRTSTGSIWPGCQPLDSPTGAGLDSISADAASAHGRE